MQSSPASMAFRPVSTHKTQLSPHFGRNVNHEKTSPEPSQENQSLPAQLDEVNTTPPISPIDEPAYEAAIQRQMETHHKAAEGIITGLKQGFDVLALQRDWRKQFSDSNQKEDFLEQLASVWDLTVARFREGFPKKDEDQLRQSLENPEAVEANTSESKITPQADQSTDSEQPTSSLNNKVASSKESNPKKDSDKIAKAPKHQENPDAFRRYAKVIAKYPELALLNEEHLPFDLGTQAALASPKPDILLKKLGIERKRLAQLQQRMRQHVESNKLNKEQAQSYASSTMEKELPSLRDGVNIPFHISVTS